VSFSFTVDICTYSITHCYTNSYDKVEWQQLDTVLNEFLVTVNVIYFTNDRYIECLSLTYATNKSKT
jgi:hypothetical protein